MYNVIQRNPKFPKFKLNLMGGRSAPVGWRYLNVGERMAGGDATYRCATYDDAWSNCIVEITADDIGLINHRYPESCGCGTMRRIN